MDQLRASRAAIFGLATCVMAIAEQPATRPADANCCAVPSSVSPCAAIEPTTQSQPPLPTKLATLLVRDGMVRLPIGRVLMGNTDPEVGYPTEEGPIVDVPVKSIWIDVHEVTNQHFKTFVEATGYVTVAERTPNPADFPGAPREMIVPGSVVFVAPSTADLRGGIAQWWKFVPGACWRTPEGPGSSIDDRMDHPVVQVAFEDAEAYAKWAGKRLPSEAEWEYAARGGLVGNAYAWGDKLMPDGKPLANIWEGDFPTQNTLTDGFLGTAPVGRFTANGYGLHDVAGNVWEWTTTWYRQGHEPFDPLMEQSFDPEEPDTAKRVTKGGSFLCAANYCKRYRPAARSRTTPDTGLSNLGFRCVRDAVEGDEILPVDNTNRRATANERTPKEQPGQ